MSWKKPTAGVILAAGDSSRFGQPKQLLKLNNKYLIEWVLDASLNSRLKEVVLVLGHEHRKILKALEQKTRHPNLRVVVNPKYSEGQSRSLKLGFLKIQKAYPSVMFLLGDQPLLDSEMIDYMLEAFWHSEKDICVPVNRGQRGNPTIFSRKFYKHFLKITGDMGARQLIETHPDNILEVEVTNPLYLLDIDTKKDFTNLQSLLKKTKPL
jgi:molybdenum cofactor cytidylyltransferase